ncbi:hypothetical protein RRF57_007410 [Xylaria bambusicola]|uniref:Uncharacterized protein n=1 Tax=Xylaria bambusicola TaxID=326684 RepID=A0AAN7URX2_9PEZI
MASIGRFNILRQPLPIRARSRMLSLSVTLGRTIIYEFQPLAPFCCNNTVLLHHGTRIGALRPDHGVQQYIARSNVKIGAKTFEIAARN